MSQLDSISKTNPNALEVSIWLSKLRPKFLTIQDIKNIPIGKSVELLLICRNFSDAYMQAVDSGVVAKPREFCKYAYQLTFTKTDHPSGIYGTWLWHFSGSNQQQEFDREFELEITRCQCVDCPYYCDKPCGKFMWYPLEGGCMRISEAPLEYRMFKLDGREAKPVDEYPTNTRIGWRGPMVFLEDIDSMPDVYWLKEESQIEWERKFDASWRSMEQLIKENPMAFNGGNVNEEHFELMSKDSNGNMVYRLNHFHRFDNNEMRFMFHKFMNYSHAMNESNPDCCMYCGDEL